MSKGIYIHIPFCRKKCPYCDFYSAPGTEATQNAYVSAVLHAIDTSPEVLCADTLYLGGGTPTLLGAPALCEILSAAAKKFNLPSDGEYTIEANPGTVTRNELELLQNGGYNRISFGVQSLDDDILWELGRIHNSAEALEAIWSAHDVGFSHISADLMLAVPHQTKRQIWDSVLSIAKTPIDHLSAYMLQIEEGTPFYASVPTPEEGFAIACYETACDAAKESGFAQYEISNFARNIAAQSRHNLHYWRCEEYLGIGPAAHSFLNGRRFYFPRNREGFVCAENPWDIVAYDGNGGDEEEIIMLGLRLCEGISPADFSPGTSARLIKNSKPLISGGLMRYVNGRLSLTRRGFEVSNAVIAELI